MNRLLFGNGAVSLENIDPYQTIDWAPETAFDDLTRLAACICQTPIALLCSIDTSRWCLKSQVGLEPESSDSYLAFCRETILQLEALDSPLLVVEDALADERFASCELVASARKIRFYARVPLVTPQGLILGILAAIDSAPRQLTSQQQEALVALSRQAISLAVGGATLELQKSSKYLEGTTSEYPKAEEPEAAFYKELATSQQVVENWTHFVEYSPDLLCVLGLDGCFKCVNPAFAKILAYSKEELLSQPFLDFVHPEDKAATYEQWQKLGINTPSSQFETRYRCQDGSYKWLAWNSTGNFGAGLVYAIAREIVPSKKTKATLLARSHVSTLEADVGEALSIGGTLLTSLQRCTDAVVQHLDAIGAGIWTIDSLTVGEALMSPLRLQASAGRLTSAEIFPEYVFLNHGLVGTIAQTRQPLNTQLSLQNESIGTTKDYFNTFFSGYPLTVQSRLVGVLALHTRQPLSDVVHGVMGWVAKAIAMAVDHFWMQEELLNRREALMFQLASQIRNSLDLDTILDTAVTGIRNLLGVDCCHFLWCSPESEQPSLSVTHEACNPESPSLLGECPSEFAPLAEKIRSLSPLKINDFAEVPGLDSQTRSLLTNWGITSGLLLPLKTHSGQLGAIVCSHYDEPHLWSDREVELLQAVVDQLAIAIEHAELFAQTREAALAAQTQAQQLEMALRELKETEARLIQTEKMSSLGQMIAGIAHEINNPVNFITANLSHATNYIQDLLDLIHRYLQHYPNPDANIQEFIVEIDLNFLIEDLPKILSSMKMGADRIQEIVVSLRNFSRTDEVEMTPVNIHEGIDSTLLILHNRMKANGNNPGISVIKEYSDLPPVECYASQLNQVFMNIISNAIDALEGLESCKVGRLEGSNQPANPACSNSYTEQPFKPSQPTIWICTEVLDGERVGIRIRDNGPGMHQSVINRLFDPFFTTKPAGKGTGLGLSISYQIVVEKHGGAIECFSKPDEGAEFWIQIPIAQPKR